MAQYWEDWSGSTIGSAPTGWTARFVTAGVTYTVEADALGPAGRRLRIVTSSTQARRLISADAVDIDADRATFEVAALIKIAPIADNALGLLLAGRGVGGAANETCVAAGLIRTDVGDTLAYRGVQYKNGTSTLLGAIESDNLWTPGEVYWLRTRVVGNTVTFTLADGANPANVLKTWTSNDTLTATAAGWLGIFTFHKSLTWDVYAVGFGTNGDVAPTSDPTVHALAGSATISASASADLTTSAVSIKGVLLSMGDGATPIDSITGITALWWDASPPTGAPDYETTAAIDASGKLTLDIDAVTALAIGDYGTLGLTKPGATVSDDVGNLFRVQVVDIS